MADKETTGSGCASSGIAKKGAAGMDTRNKPKDTTKQES